VPAGRLSTSSSVCATVLIIESMHAVAQSCVLINEQGSQARPNLIKMIVRRKCLHMQVLARSCRCREGHAFYGIERPTKACPAYRNS
jgi:hypothetical protein